MGEILNHQGNLDGHTDWITCVCISQNDQETVVSASRDKKLIVWNLTRVNTHYGLACRALSGHSHIVQDLAMSSDGKICLSGSWDGTLRLWDINTGRTFRRFVRHTKDVLCVSFSPDNRMIISGSRDKTIILWNTLGKCMFVLEDGKGHDKWVSCVRFTAGSHPTVVSCGWDKLVKIWDLTNCTLKHSLVGHNGYLNTITVSVDGTLCASGGNDGKVIVWDILEAKKLYDLEINEVISALSFNPKRYWLCVATHTSIKIFCLWDKNKIEDFSISDYQHCSPRSMKHYCTCLYWSSDGSTLFAGYTDAKIRVYSVERAESDTTL